MNTNNKTCRDLFTVTLFRNVCIGVALFSMVAMAPAPVNLSGEWSLNNDKSEFGNSQFRFAANKLKITQDASNISIERSGTGRNGEAYSYTEKMTLDGKESENSTFQGRTRKSTAKWSPDGKSLTITSTMSFDRNGETFTVNSTEVYSLSSDKVLAIDVDSTSPRGETKNKLIYDKQ